MADATRKRDPEATREAILDAAREVFVAHGYEGASIRKVGDRAGFSHGTIYLYFRDKDDLLYQLSEEHFRQLLTRLRSLPHALDPVSRVREAFRTVVDYGLEYPNQYHLMIAMRPPHVASAGNRSFGPMAQEVFGYLYDALDRASGRGRLATGKPHLETWGLLAEAHGVIEFYRVGVISREQAGEVAERAIDVLLNGLRSGRGGAGAGS